MAWALGYRKRLMMTRDVPEGAVVLVSACLLGVFCRYDGRCTSDDRVLALTRRFRLVPICPEQLGGLSTPRPPVELRQGRAVCIDGFDVTEAFQRGVEQVAHIASLTGARTAILQPRSPSCGVGLIYDGTFSGRLVPGQGMLATCLEQTGVRLFSPDDLDEAPGEVSAVG